ncbi:PilZ domain-containing protein [Blastococcus saxobsidens]|uniref:PilZ domain-containing protein n=1 Tax=Blastococcus saxobsidens TaxID=138336 RepID=A0A6L9W1I3_9ACTN|nr:PilZ domain-containing protein [Blastococcus saxobsidens]
MEPDGDRPGRAQPAAAQRAGPRGAVGEHALVRRSAGRPHGRPQRGRDAGPGRRLGSAPGQGTRTDVTLDLGDTTVHVKGEIVRQTSQGPRWLLSMQFLDVSETTGDALRRRVFKALRDERAAAAG